MAAFYPGQIKTFSTKESGQAIASSHINDLQNEVVAIETQLGTNAGTWQSWTPTVTGWAAGYTCIARYCKVGKMCFVYLYISGTSNDTNARATLPLSASGEPRVSYFQVPAYRNNSILDYIGGQCIAQVRPSDEGAGANEVWFWLDGSYTGWTASGDKYVQTTLFYEAA